MQTLFSNVVPLAALAIVATTCITVLVAVVGSVLGRPLDATAADIVKNLLSVTIGIAVGAGAYGGYIAQKAMKVFDKVI